MNHAPLDADHVSRRWLGKATHELPANAASVVRRAAERRPISEDINETFDDRQTFGDGWRTGWRRSAGPGRS